MSILKFIFPLIIFISLNIVFAQSLQFGVSVASQNKDITDFHSETFLKLNNLNLEDAKLSFRIASNLFTPIELGLEAQYNLSWGPFGNIRLKGSTDIDSDGLADINASAEGVLGSLAALEANLMLFNVDKGHFALESAYGDRARPRYNTNELVFGFGLGGRYRLERTLILEVNPTLVLTENTLGGYGNAALHFRHLVERDDGIAKLKFEKNPTTNDAYGAIGFEYRLSRRNWPALQATIWLAAGTEGIYPGGVLKLKHKLKDQPITYEIELAAEPYRIDGIDYSVSASLVFELELGELNFQVLGAPDNESLLPELALQVGYSWHF